MTFRKMYAPTSQLGATPHRSGELDNGRPRAASYSRNGGPRISSAALRESLPDGADVPAGFASQRRRGSCSRRSTGARKNRTPATADKALFATFLIDVLRRVHALADRLVRLPVGRAGYLDLPDQGRVGAELEAQVVGARRRELPSQRPDRPHEQIAVGDVPRTSRSGPRPSGSAARPV